MNGMTGAYSKAWRSFSMELRTAVTSAINMAIIITSANMDTAIIHPMDMADTAGKNQKKFIHLSALWVVLMRHSRRCPPT